jgi:hypothetical protein
MLPRVVGAHELRPCGTVAAFARLDVASLSTPFAPAGLTQVTSIARAPARSGFMPCTGTNLTRID